MSESYFGPRQITAAADFWQQTRFRLKATWDGVSNVKDAISQAKRRALNRRFHVDDQAAILLIRLELEFYTLLDRTVKDATSWDDLIHIVNAEVAAFTSICKQIS